MPHIIEVTDLAAPELDVYARLTEAQLRRVGYGIELREFARFQAVADRNVVERVARRHHVGASGIANRTRRYAGARPAASL